MNKMTFQEFFQTYGEYLLRGWLRAGADGNDECFPDWVIGEYDCYMEGEYRCPNCDCLIEPVRNMRDKIRCDECRMEFDTINEQPYEVPYFGLLDEPTEDEIKILGDSRIFISLDERGQPDD